MFKKLIAFFTHLEYPLGALESPKDSRTIKTTAVQAPVTLPDDFNSLTPPVENQGSVPMCVAEVVHELKELYLLAGGNFVALSPDDLYAQCKAADGIPNIPGTYPLVALKLAVSSGIASSSVYASGDTLAITADRAKYKLGGFMAVPSDFHSVCQAIYQNKAIAMSFNVDGNWFNGIITKVLQSIGRHYTLGHGFNVPAGIVRGQNSWGVGWMGKVAGYIDPLLAPGHFDVKWSDVSDSVVDLYTVTDNLPAPVLNHVQALNYHFNAPMQFKQQSYDVMQLQKRLAQEGFWPAAQAFTGYYGMITASQVLALQIAKGIITDATQSGAGDYVGPKTLAWLNGEVGLDLLHAQIQVESEGNDYAIGDSGAGFGCLQAHEPVVDQVNAVLGTTHTARDLLGNRDLSVLVWTTYFEKVHPEMKTPEQKAKTWNGGPGYAMIEAVVNKTPAQVKYCSNIATYWSKVSAMMA